MLAVAGAGLWSKPALDEADYERSEPAPVDVYVSHAWADSAPRGKAAALRSFLLVQSLTASVLVMGVMLSLACCPIGFMLADMTQPSEENGGASSGSWSMSGSGSGTFGWVDETESEDGIAWWWPAVIVNGISVGIVAWVWLSGMVLPTSWGPWRLSDKRLWVDKCCASYP
eukprot:COSAG04_NODE_5762_length_1500_cov_2.457530_1_plen_171_part_00